MCFFTKYGLKYIDAYVDSDWAGDKVSRKSTTGVILKVGGDAIKTYSRNQKTIALSSGEAELYATVSGMAEAIGIQSICYDFGFNCEIRCFSDSSAAVGIVKREGIGKVRHLQTQFLWVQEMTSNGKATIHKVGTNDNPADLLTKYLDSNTIDKHLQHINLHTSSHRPLQAPHLVGISVLNKTPLRYVTSSTSGSYQSCEGVNCTSFLRGRDRKTQPHYNCNYYVNPLYKATYKGNRICCLRVSRREEDCQWPKVVRGKTTDTLRARGLTPPDLTRLGLL